MFVANRVRSIQKLTNSEFWLHCPGVDNPADLMTRGYSASKLVTSQLWLEGPSWLSLFDIDTLSERHQLDVVSPDPSIMMLVTSEILGMSLSLVAVGKYESPFPFERWGTFAKVVKVVAYVLRFIENLKLARAGSGLKNLNMFESDELEHAKLTVLSSIQKASYSSEILSLGKHGQVSRTSSIFQLSPMLDNEGMLRVKGRLQFSDLAYEEKHPLILPRCHVTLLIVRELHQKLSHAGVSTLITAVRAMYWIVGLRGLVKRVKFDCVPCRRLDAVACGQPIAPLPELRVKQAPAFSVTGMDYAGPVYCLDEPGHKLYILLLTCAVVRAVHLEITDSLDLDDFLLAIRRFVARRGLPSTIYSDNAKTFIAGGDRVRKMLGNNSPRFVRINPVSPWWGGWWERLVRSVKSGLKKSVGKACLRRRELETVLVEVEACINSRPLTTVGDSIDSLTPLTPSHFLIGRVASFPPAATPGDTDDVEMTHLDLSNREKHRLQLLDSFWSTWSRDYLCNLPPTLNRFRKLGNLKVGSVVLVKEDHIPRMRWPLGLVVRMFPGRDGVCRSVVIRTAKGEFVRSIQRLYDLEVCRDPLAPTDKQPETSTRVETKVEKAPPRTDTDNDICVDTVDSGVSVDTDVIPLHRTTRVGRVVRPKVRLDL